MNILILTKLFSNLHLPLRLKLSPINKKAIISMKTLYRKSSLITLVITHMKNFSKTIILQHRVKKKRRSKQIVFIKMMKITLGNLVPIHFLLNLKLYTNSRPYLNINPQWISRRNRITIIINIRIISKKKSNLSMMIMIMLLKHQAVVKKKRKNKKNHANPWFKV